MSKIATFKRSVEQATEQRQTDWQALEEATQRINQLHEALDKLPNQLAKRMLPAVQALDAIVLSTQKTLKQTNQVLADLAQAKRDTETTTQVIEHQAMRLEETASNLLREHQKKTQNDLVRIAALSAIGASILTAIATSTTLWFWL